MRLPHFSQIGRSGRWGQARRLHPLFAVGPHTFVCLLDQRELRDQLWLQLGPLDADASLGQTHNLRIEPGSAATRSSFGRNLDGNVQQRLAWQKC